MSRLTANSHPAERMRGCTFAETFENAEKTVLNGATLVGAPDINFGANLDGSNDYITYDGYGVYNNANVSILIEFTPDFDTDSNTVNFLFTSTNGSRYRLNKENNASNNTLKLFLGDTEITDIAEATYSPYWNVGEKNTLIVSGTTGNTNVWLNNNQIVTADNTAWTAKNPANIWIGSYGITPGSFLFDGTIHTFKVWNQILTAQEVADYTNGTTFNLANQATFHLLMGLAQDDTANTKTLDLSRTGADATLVHAPPKISDRHGYTLDGSNDYMTATGTGVFNTAEVGIVIEFTPHFAVDEDKNIYILDSSSGNRYLFGKANNTFNNVLNLHLGNTVIAYISEATYSPYWYQNQKNVIVISGTTGNTNAWLNGNQILTSASTEWTAKNPANLYIGAANDAAGNFDGDINQFWTVPRLITPTQMYDIQIQSDKKWNDN